MKYRVLILGVIASVLANTSAFGGVADVDGDGDITATDSAFVFQRVLNSKFELPTQGGSGDVDGDGEITAGDASYILQKALNLDFVLPIEEVQSEEDLARSKKVEDIIEVMLANNPPDAPTWNTEKLRIANWNYINGCMLKAFEDLYNSTGDKKYMEFNNTFLDYYVDSDGSIPLYKKSDYNLDNINSGKALFGLYNYTKNAKYRSAIDTLYAQLEDQPRTDGGNFYHKKTYPSQVWLDGLYMAQPFYMKYEVEYNNSTNVDDIFKQFNNVHELMRDSETGLYYHGYDESKSQSWADKTTGLSKSFWLRAMAWYAMAQVDTIEIMPEGENKNTMISQFAEYMQAVKNYQDEKTGMWYQVVDKAGSAGNYLETSGSAGMAYAMMKGARLGYIDESYYEVGKKAFDGICDNKITGEGEKVVLKDICIVAGLGGTSKYAVNHPNRDGTYEYYVDEKVGTNDAKGIAPLLYAYCEIQKNNKK